MITILMPVKNGIEFLDESVNSVKEQIYEEWELLIGINGFEKDSSVYNNAKKYESDKIKILDLHYCYNKPATLNEMIKYSKYDWISLLDVDDKWSSSKLLTQSMYMDKYDVIGTLAQYFGDSNIKPRLPIGDLSTFDFFSFNPIINSSCLLKKHLALWDTTTELEDYDLWLKLWKNKYKFFNVSSIETYHRIHTDSAFNSKGNNLLVSSIQKRYR
jgi:glycosyltransferase involved in cell wall biosynthesis